MESPRHVDADGEKVIEATEIIQWCKRLMDEPKYGWWFDSMCLAKTLGFVGQSQLRRYVFGGKPLPLSLQKRVSRQLRRILIGELVMIPSMKRGKQCGVAQLTASPKPLIENKPKALGFMSIGRKGLKLNMIPAAQPSDAPRMPTFAEVLERKNARST